MIKCKECNKEINENIKKCPNCGCPNNFYIKRKKKKFIIYLLTLIIVVIVILFVIYNYSKINKKQQDLDKQDVLKEELTEIGKKFYENYYYDSIEDNEERKKFLSNYSTKGIKIDLANLKRDNNLKISNRINNCSNETKVIIYPKEPYGKEDYRIEVILFCD